MEQEQIIEFKRLIVEYMQLPTRPRTWDDKPSYLHGNLWHVAEKLKYDTSWNWLMEVVDKIEQQDAAIQIYRRCVVCIYDWKKYSVDDFVIDTGRDNHHAIFEKRPDLLYVSPFFDKNKRYHVFIACVKYIQWHNEK